jgi:hypothetical protein
MAGLYCTQPAGLREVRLETFPITSARIHAEVIIIERIPDKTLPERISRKSFSL